jgi:hypothetical protein
MLHIRVRIEDLGTNRSPQENNTASSGNVKRRQGEQDHHALYSHLWDGHRNVGLQGPGIARLLHIRKFIRCPRVNALGHRVDVHWRLQWH